MSLIVNRRDLEFQLYEVSQLDLLFLSNRFAAYDRQTIDDMIDSAQAIAEGVFYPFAAKLDANEPTYEGGHAVMIPEVKHALDEYAAAGLLAASFDQDVGGLQLPFVIQLVLGGLFSAANHSVSNFTMLTVAAANLLNAFGSAQQKALFLPPMLEGRWFGTMCLSETQAGSSLADIRTLATPRADGLYNITGSKMWISGGDHDASENIVHMLLAKTPDAPKGVRGISLFIVPKHRVTDDGVVGDTNNISLAGLNHKMGQRGTPNTVLNFGDGGESIGYLVGQLHQGLQYMFHMMNEARIQVGAGATMLGLTGYLHSLDYAKNRLQGRTPGNKNPQSPPVPIIEHADVKRMLIAQRASVEGALSLILFCGTLVDRLSLEITDGEHQRLSHLLEILTPIVKSWPSEYCLEANKLAIQVLGGYGYTRDYPVERFYRDNRLNPIHEGTHGIQGIDLLGRKVTMDDGEALKTLLGEIRKTTAEAPNELSEESTSIARYAEQLDNTTRIVCSCNDINLRLANATLYLDAAGHLVIAWMWLRQAIAAVTAINQGTAEQDFYSGKLLAARYFFRYELPRAGHQFDIVASLDETTTIIRPQEFVPE